MQYWTPLSAFSLIALIVVVSLQGPVYQMQLMVYVKVLENVGNEVILQNCIKRSSEDDAY